MYGMFAAMGGGTVFGRRQTRTHSELMREEFGEGLGHLRMSAAHAAGTAAGLIAPRLDSVRERIEPAFEKSLDMTKDTVRASARRANRIARRATGRKRESKTAKRGPLLVGGLMIAGAVAGVVGALLSRRQKRWIEYGSIGTTTGLRDEARSLADSAQATGSSVASPVAESSRETAR